MPMKPSARSARKVHRLSAMTGGGFHRTLCGHNISNMMNATDNDFLVTCAVCLWRMQ